jgi:hypothetical protein
MKVVACPFLFVNRQCPPDCPLDVGLFWSCASQPYATHADVVLNAEECYPILPGSRLRYRGSFWQHLLFERPPWA